MSYIAIEGVKVIVGPELVEKAATAAAATGADDKTTAKALASCSTAALKRFVDSAVPKWVQQHREKEKCSD